MLSYQTILHVTRKELYELLLQQTASDISVKTEKDLTIDDIKKGYKYQYQRKGGKNPIMASVHIFKPSLDHLETHYELSSGERFVMKYLLKDLEDQCEVEYIQDNGKKPSSLETFLFRRQMKKRFKQIENYLISKKG